MDEGKMMRIVTDEALARENEYRRLLGLINSSNNEDIPLAEMRNALHSGVIKNDDYIGLTDHLLERHGEIQSGLVDLGHKQTSQVEELNIDPVTQLFKRDSLIKKLSGLITELNHKPEPGESRREPPLHAILVIFVDLDNLKKWNDKYSHNTGDRALQSVANYLRRVTRDTDFIFRWGEKSDEMILAIRVEKEMTDEEIYNQIYKKIEGGVNEEYIEIDKTKLPVTASIGYVILKPGEKRGIDEIINASDVDAIENKQPEIKRQRIADAKKKLKNRR